LSFLAPVEGVLNLWLAPVEDLDAATLVTRESSRPIREHLWAPSARHLLYLQDTDGDENHHLYCIEIYSDDTVSDDPVDLTPFDGVKVRIGHLSPRHPAEMLIGLNDRDEELHDLYRLNLDTAALTPVCENRGFLGFVADEDLRVRLALEPLSGGGVRLLEHLDDGSWGSFLEIPAEDESGMAVLGFDASGGTLYMRSSVGRDTAALVSIDMRSSSQRVVKEDPLCDAGTVLFGPEDRAVEAVSFTYARTEWEAVDEAVARDFELLREMGDADIAVTSRDTANEHWVVSFSVDTGPLRYYLYDRGSGSATLLFADRPDLERLPLARMHTVVIPSRDGRDLVSYYTLPLSSAGKALPEAPCPTVLLVHGGPWARDCWGYSPFHQWLASRGYAVLSVNFRGSTGFGKAFTNAANREWAASMHDDLIDAVDWAVDRGISAEERIAIMGASYGGYAALVGLTFTPTRFACGVDLVGPSSLLTLLESIPPYWAPLMEMFARRVGDPRTPEGRELLAERSPLERAEQIVRPLLIGQGSNDPRVKQAESDRIVEAMVQQGIPVTYALYPDEGHGFARPENRLSFFAVAEAFLAAWIGGECQDVEGDFRGSSIRIVAGAEHVPGLREEIENALLEEEEDSC
jgi:dipeptidyl aminopeptidase/acylaminoacyl peptidase